MKTILFQGDSITDGRRLTEANFHMGFGYPGYVAARLGLDHPGEYNFVNRGVSSNKSVDIYARIKADIINVKPDILSILMGINDVGFDVKLNTGVSTQKYRKIYSMMLDEIFEALPDVKIILLEPFVHEGSNPGEYYEEMRVQVEEKATVVRELAQKYGCTFIPLQQELDRMVKQAPKDYWLVDGVHPSIYFHQYIADRWLEAFAMLS